MLNSAATTGGCCQAISLKAELWIGGEKHIINKTFGAYIPPNVEAGPFIVRGVKQQMFLELAYPIGEGVKKYKGG
jgi:hypothetical protein